MSKGSLSIQNVALTYGKAEKRVVALNGISFEVRPNEFTVIVGPSGCGKSSLLYIAAGLTEATSGSIVASGRTVDAPAGPRHGVPVLYAVPVAHGARQCRVWAEAQASGAA